MPHEAKKYLYDVCRACEAILEFVKGKSLEDYSQDLLLQSGVERQFMIAGEALNQALRIEPDLSETISNAREIVNLRYVIVHGYAVIENETICGILENDLPQLYEEVRKLL